MVIFFTIFFTIYSAVNYYIFIRGWQALAAVPQLRIAYTVIFVAASLSYLAARFFEKYLPAVLYDIILSIGSFWFAFMLYFFLSVVLIDIIRLLNWKLDFYPSFINNNYAQTKFIAALTVIFIVSLIVSVGFINTRDIKIKTLLLKLPKRESKLSGLNAVMMSDIHLSPLNGKSLLNKIIDKVNSLNPDIVFIAGDIVDDRAHILSDRNIGPALLRLKPKYGVYAINGNHEFINGVEEADKYMTKLNIKVLRDTAVKIDDGFYVIGRDDNSKKQFTGIDRIPLSTIISKVEKNFPLILMDHTPFRLKEAVDNGIDLQLSGHTHHGQMYPLNFITNLIYEVSWGYLKKGKTQYYVSSGVGTWGPAVRLGSDTEIINMKIKFVD